MPEPTRLATGAARKGKAAVPVVDLTMLVRSLYVLAEEARKHRAALTGMAAFLATVSDALEELAAVLSGDRRE